MIVILDFDPASDASSANGSKGFTKGFDPAQIEPCCAAQLLDRIKAYELNGHAYVSKSQRSLVTEL